jgi:hypothetical protein
MEKKIFGLNYIGLNNLIEKDEILPCNLKNFLEIKVDLGIY